MRKALTMAALAAIGVGAADLAFGQGPVREGLRRTGEAAADITRGAVQGAAGTVRAAGDALTPATPRQARPGANLSALDASRDARWRFSRHNGEWWYYTPENQWMYHRDGDWRQFSQESFQGVTDADRAAQVAQADATSDARQHQSGYRGVEHGEAAAAHAAPSQAAHHGSHPQVRHDCHGRAYICENGRPVYLDEGPLQGHARHDSSPASPTPAIPEEHSALRQSEDQPGVTETPTPAPAEGSVGAEAGVSAGSEEEANAEAAASAVEAATPAQPTPAN